MNTEVRVLSCENRWKIDGVQEFSEKQLSYFCQDGDRCVSKVYVYVVAM